MEEMIELLSALSAGLSVAWFIITFLIGLYPKYYMFKAANITPWLAFVPIVGDAMTLKLIGMSPLWYILFYGLSYIPVLGCLIMGVFNAILSWTISDRFGLGTLGKILSLFFFGITQWYIALARKQYRF